MLRFDGFTEKANQVLNCALEKAQELGHDYVGSEHMLLGMLLIGENTASEVLEKLGASASQLETLIREKVPAGEPTRLDSSDLTPRSKRILQTARAKASSHHQPYVGTEHILLAILEERDSYGLRFLVQMGATPSAIRQSLTGAEGAGEKLPERSEKHPEHPEKKPLKSLERFGRDLTCLASEGKLDPVVGRQAEIQRMIQILCRRTKNNPVLLGEPGVGKTAVVEGLAQLIQSEQVPDLLREKRIFSLDLTGMVAGTRYRGDFEERVKNALDEVRRCGNVILFLDELHTLVGTGGGEGTADAANILKPALSRGEIQIIGTSTVSEYRRYIEKDGALERRFQPVKVGEPTQEEAEKILYGLRDRYEAHHRVKITDEDIQAAVRLSARYIPDRFLPDKAIDVMDESASRVRLSAYTAPDGIRQLEQKVRELEQEKTSAVNAQDFERAASLRDEQKELRRRLEEQKESWKDETKEQKGEVTAEDVAGVVSLWTGVPVSRLTEEEGQRLLHLEERLHGRIVWQEEAVSAVAKAIRRGRVGLKDPKRPIGSFLFLGPTGVGKTELCRALAEVLFGDETAMLRFDMSEYMEKHTVSRLVGSPPGYVGYEEGGQLTEAVRSHPYSVVLFDEIEKAHPDVFNLLLQILEDGRLTDSQGRHVDFRNTVVIMTSNIGARLITSQNRKLGFSSGEESEVDAARVRELVMEEVKKLFRPEFLNRVDECIVFRKLTDEQLGQITVLMLKSLSRRAEDLGLSVTFSEEAVAEIARQGRDPLYGARPLRRVIQTGVETLMAEELLSGHLQAGVPAVCRFRENRFVFDAAEIKVS